MRFSFEEAARMRGWRDYHAGVRYSECPYKGEMAAAWKMGWIEAEKEAE